MACIPLRPAHLSVFTWHSSQMMGEDGPRGSAPDALSSRRPCFPGDTSAPATLHASASLPVYKALSHPFLCGITQQPRSQV